MDRERFRQERIEIIRQRMDTYKPTLVVMYGDSKERREHWEDVAGNVFPPKVLKHRPTLIVLAPIRQFQVNGFKMESDGRRSAPEI